MSSPWSLREILLFDVNAHRRAHAAASIGSERAAEVAVALIDALDDTHPSVRDAAIRALVRFPSVVDRARLSELARGEPIWWVRRSAALACAAVFGERVLDVLLEALEDPFWRVRHAAIRALLLLAGDKPALRSLIVSSPARSPAARAARVYLQRRFEGIVEPLPASAPSPSLTWDPDPAVVTARLEDPAEQARAARSLFLVECLGDPHTPLRKLARRTLAAIGPDERTLEALALWLEEPRIPHAAAEVIALLDRLGTPAAELARRWIDTNAGRGALCWAMSYAAEAGLGELATAIAERALSHDLAIRSTAIAAVARFLQTASSKTLRKLALEVFGRALHDVDPRVRSLAAHALQEMREPEAGELLLALSLDEQPARVRREIVVFAAKKGALAVLLVAARDQDAATRATAVSALNELDKLPPDLRAEAIVHPDPWIRSAALDQHNAGAHLVADPSPAVRLRAFEILRPSELRTLLAVAGDVSPELRALAAERLAAHPDLSNSISTLLEAGLAGPVRETAEAWRMVELSTEALAAMASSAPRSAPRPRNASFPARATLSPLAISGAHQLPLRALDRAAEAGVNLYFWEPRYRTLSKFLRRHAQKHGFAIIAGTYHASPRAIIKDVDRALLRLRVDQLHTFLLFWVRSKNRLSLEAIDALSTLRDRGKIGAIGFSTHDRALAAAAINTASSPWQTIMIRHSAAHPGAEDELFPLAAARGVSTFTFSATCYGRMLRDRFKAADCYRYSLAQPSVAACISAPRRERELIENLSVLEAPAIEHADLEELRAYGRRVRLENQDFAALIRRFPATSDEALHTLLDTEVAPSADAL